MQDWLNIFIVNTCRYFGRLKLLAKPQKRTEAEFEKNAAESASMLGTSLSALQGILDPAGAKAKEVRMQLKSGRYNKKKHEGKASGEDLSEENND